MQKFAVFAIALALLAGPAAAITPGKLEFDVFRNGNKEGSHVVDVTQNGDEFRASTSIDISGRVAGVFGYSYRHRCTEIWSGDRVQSLNCEDREGNDPPKGFVAKRDGDALIVSSQKTNGRVDGPVFPSAWWNIGITQASRMIDTRTGEVLPIKVANLGREQVQTAGGAIAATRYRIIGSSPVEVWYDDQGRWVGMKFRGRGQNFEYRLRTSPSAAPSA